MPVAPEIAAVLGDCLGLVQQALDTCETAETANAKLREKIAEQDRVLLEKVAAEKTATPKLSRVLIDDTLTRLEDSALLDPADRAKIAAELAADPNAALKLAQRLLSLSTPAHEEGRAVAPSASHQAPTSDPDGWNQVIRPRAA